MAYSDVTISKASPVATGNEMQVGSEALAGNMAAVLDHQRQENDLH